MKFIIDDKVNIAGIGYTNDEGKTKVSHVKFEKDDKEEVPPKKSRKKKEAAI